MGMGMGVSFQYPIGIDTGMGMIFENGYGCEYNSTRPELAPLPFLLNVENPSQPDSARTSSKIFSYEEIYICRSSVLYYISATLNLMSNDICLVVRHFSSVLFQCT